MTTSFKLDDLMKTGSQRQHMDLQSTLNAMTGVKLSAKEARESLPRIENHKWYMSERLGRDVGLRVAAIDYFENIYEPRHAARYGSATLGQKLYCLAKQSVALYLSHQSWKAHDGVFLQSQDEFTWPEAWDKSLSEDRGTCSELMSAGVKVTHASYASS
ncbi:MAG TPA: DUF4032 domain-containing protein [Pyrinomonadaceae bacterium]|jgi:hypothetical protein